MSGLNFSTAVRALNIQDIAGVTGLSVAEASLGADVIVSTNHPSFQASGLSVAFQTVENEQVLINHIGRGSTIFDNTDMIVGYRIDGGSTLIINTVTKDNAEEAWLCFSVFTGPLSAGPHTVEIMLARTPSASNWTYRNDNTFNKSTLQVVRIQSGINANFLVASHRKGAALEAVTDTAMQINSGELGFSDGKIRKNTSAVTWDVSNDVGELGFADASDRAVASTLDASDRLYGYAVPKSADDDQWTVVLSDNPPSVGPTNYSIWRYLLMIKTNSSADFIRIIQVGDYFEYNADKADVQFADHTDFDGSWNLKSLSAFVPENCKKVRINGHLKKTGAIIAISFKPATTFDQIETYTSPSTPISAWSHFCNFDIPLNSSYQIDTRASEGTLDSGSYCMVAGYYDINVELY